MTHLKDKAIQRDLGKLEKWPMGISQGLTRLVLHLGRVSLQVSIQTEAGTD